MSGKIKHIIKKIVLIFWLSFTGMFALLYIFVYMVQKDGNSKLGLEWLPEEESVSSEVTTENHSTEEKEAETDSLAEQWGIRITPKSKLDFHKVLWKDDYRSFSGKDISEKLDELFSFAYPKNLYHKVEVSIDDSQQKYSILFQGKDNGALLLYSQEKQEKGSDFSSVFEKLYRTDITALSEAGTIYHGETVYVIDGFENQGQLEVYKVVKMDVNHIYTMLIKTPVPETEEEKAIVDYYTEYLYRSCGFSGSSKEPRSYSEYLLGINQ